MKARIHLPTGNAYWFERTSLCAAPMYAAGGFNPDEACQVETSAFDSADELELFCFQLAELLHVTPEIVRAGIIGTPSKQHQTEAQRLVRFAEHTLARMEHDEDWNSETFDSIAECAKDLELAGYDANSMFKRR